MNRNDHDAMQQLVCRLLPVIRSRVGTHFHRRRGRPIGPNDAEDFIQETWATLLADGGRQLLAHDPARGMTLEGYVGMLCRRELWKGQQEANRVKRGAVEVTECVYEHPIADDAASPEDDVVGRDLLTSLLTHLGATLPSRGVAVLDHLCVDPREPREAADALGVNLQVIYNWRHRIREESREFLAGAGVRITGPRRSAKQKKRSESHSL